MKKDGAPRICGDFKVTVNPVLTAEQYPLPPLFSCLAGGQKFSKVDLCQAYFQMHVYPVSGTVDHSDTQRSVQVPEAPFWNYLCSSTFSKSNGQDSEWATWGPVLLG